MTFDEFQDLLRVDGADGILRSVLQHQTSVASYAFSGSAPTLMERLFEDPSRPLLEHAVSVELGPLRPEPTAMYLEERFRRTERDIGNALDPLLASRAGIHRGRCSSRITCGSSCRGARVAARPRSSMREQCPRAAEIALRARWESLAVNEQRVSLALATPAQSLSRRTPCARSGSRRAASTGPWRAWSGRRRRAERLWAGAHRSAAGALAGRARPVLILLG